MPDAPDFEEFYQANYGRLVALVAAMTGDRAEAEDVAQETFSRALSRGHRLGDYDLPEAWLRKVALRIAVDSSRRVRLTVLIAARVAAQRPRPAPLPEDAWVSPTSAARCGGCRPATGRWPGTRLEVAEFAARTGRPLRVVVPAVSNPASYCGPL